MSSKIIPFKPEHLYPCAELIVSRFRAQRRLVPHMPSVFESVDALAPKITDMTLKGPAVVAIQGGRIIGFLGGFPANNLKGKRGVFVPEWGHASVDEDKTVIYRKMYGEISAKWAAGGRFTQAIMVLAGEQGALDALFWLGFGMLCVDAVRGMEPATGDSGSDSITIRRIGKDEAEQSLPFRLELDRQLAEAPTFLPFISKDTLVEHSEWLSDPRHSFWIAHQGDKMLGYMKFEPSSPRASSIIRDDGTISITGAYTRKEARGQGIGTALLNTGLEWARGEGFTRCAVDFESANNAGSAFWLRHFRPISFSVVRVIDERMAWANENRKDEDIW